MKLPRFAFGAITACALVLLTSAASAHHPGTFFGGGNNAFGFGRHHVNQPVLPYFAQYPPVYYSGPVARPYGFSPYALPPGVLPAELSVRPQPTVVIQSRTTVNPFMDEIEPIEPEAGATTASGAKGLKLGANQQLIENPYFKEVPVSDASNIAGR